MEFIVGIFNQVLYFPLLNILILIYDFLPFKDLGVAIVILTILIRFLLYPLSKKSIQSQQAINKLQPEIKEIQKKYKKKEERARETMLLYQKYKINPVAGCLPILIQLPVLIALFRVFSIGLNLDQLGHLYSFVSRPETINFMFLGIVDLSRRSILLSVLAGFLQFIQSKMTLPQRKNSQSSGKLDFASIMNQQMIYFMPIFTIFIALNLPAALPLYWIAITLFGIVQQRLTPAVANSQEKK